ncbi:Serine/threonine-protein kinase PrkC [Novipirellula galeiformis]|uniref:Serine/threonine-protein kinase PrkC n=1 Tax=Novipirellula galeiformis TaxID=2528004 RepID=A0A5C6CIA9_9BACT|nr:WD40 repeat domain-containing serine/threonine protein kinase [Novipirellula galeiformis]TWU24168.1 Serine/threonine-protein kinase PrkC [Novipirellula galeiformis]
MSSNELPADSDSISSLRNRAAAFREELQHSGTFSFSGAPAVNETRLNAILRWFDRQQDMTATKSLASEGLSSDIEAPQKIGRFSIRGVIGVGGFATVYRAHDEMLLREVALKSIRRTAKTMTDDEDPRLREARAAARLSHPCLVPLYEAFQDVQSVYLVSEYCEGPTLAQWLKQHPGPVDPSLVTDMVLRLADAIIHVHERGLVHRDIKPQNILLQEAATAEGKRRLTPRLTDFGLVRDLFTESADDSEGRLVGTLHYMAPEQVIDSEHSHGEACDIFSIGVLMYQMLTGFLPHRGVNGADLFNAICFDNPISPRVVSGMIPRDLAAICLKCLAKNPSGRYASASALAADLNRFQQGLAVRARPRSIAERTWRAVWRSPLESSLLATVFLLIAVGVMGLARSNRRLEEQQNSLRVALADVRKSEERAVELEHQTREQRDLAKSSERVAIQTAYLSDLRNAYASLAHHNPATALQIAASIQQYADGVIPVGVDLRLLQSKARAGWTKLKPHWGPIRDIVLLPNQNGVAVVGEEGTIRIHNLDDGTVVNEFPLRSDMHVFALAVTPDETMLAVGQQIAPDGQWLNALNQVEFIALDERPAPARLIDFPTTVESLAFSPDGNQIAIGCRYESVQVFPLGSDRTSPAAQASMIIEAVRRNHYIAFFPESQHLLILKEPNEPHIVELATGKTIRRWSMPDSLDRMARSANGRFIACMYHAENYVHLLDTESPDQWITLEHPGSVTASVTLSADGTKVVAGLRNGGIATWDLAKQGFRWRDLRSWTETNADSILPLSEPQVLHNGMVTEIVLDEHGRIVSGGADGSVALSSFYGERETPALTDKKTTFAELTPDGKTVFMACDDGEVLWVDIATMQVKSVLPSNPSTYPTVLSVSKDGRWLAVGFDNGETNLVSVRHPEVTYLIPHPEAGDKHTFIESIEFDSLSNRMLVSTFAGNAVRLFKLPPRADTSDDLPHQIECVGQHAFPISHRESILFDDGRFLLFGDYIAEFQFPQSSINLVARGLADMRSACMDRSSRRVFTSAADGRIRLHDSGGRILKTSNRWESIRNGTRWAPEIVSIAMTPDQNSVLTGGDDGSIGIWNAEDLRFVGTVIEGNGKGAISNIAFASDGKRWIYHQANDDDDASEIGLRIHSID